MKNLWKNVLGLVLLSVALLMGSFNIQAKTGSGIEVKNAWVRAVPPVSQTSAAYMSLRNHGMKADRLLSVKSSISNASLHKVVQEGGMMSMRPVSHIVIPGHGTTQLQPGGFHVMLTELKHAPKLGDEIELKLTFQHAGIVTVKAIVKEGGAMMMHDKKSSNADPGHSMDHGSHGMKKSPENPCMGSSMKHGTHSMKHGAHSMQ